MADINLDTLNLNLLKQERQLDLVLTRLEAQTDLLEELLNKVDEINLPSGPGYSIDRES